MQEERDLIVKLVVACCSCEFHITAIFDDLDRRFAHRLLLLIQELNLKDMITCTRERERESNRAKRSLEMASWAAERRALALLTKWL